MLTPVVRTPEEAALKSVLVSKVEHAAETRHGQRAANLVASSVAEPVCSDGVLGDRDGAASKAEDEPSREHQKVASSNRAIREMRQAKRRRAKKAE